MTLPARRFSNDDDAAQYWLSVLKNGTRSERIEAREQLAAIFELRGMFEEATDLLISNVHDGVRSADIFRWLARLYRAQGQEVLAMQSAAEAAKYLPPSQGAGYRTPLPSEPPPPAGMAIIPPDYTNRLAPSYMPPRTFQESATASRSTERNVPMILLVALPMSWIAGIGLGLLIMMSISVLLPQNASGATVFFVTMCTSWIPIAAYWGVTSRTPRHAARRALITLAIESFALPVAGLVMGILAGFVAATAVPSGSASLAILGGFMAGGFMALGLGCVGFLFGFLFLVSWVAMRNDAADA